MIHMRKQLLSHRVDGWHVAVREDFKPRSIVFDSSGIRICWQSSRKSGET